MTMTIVDLIKSGAVEIKSPSNAARGGEVIDKLIVARPLTPDEQKVWNAYKNVLTNGMLP